MRVVSFQLKVLALICDRRRERDWVLNEFKAGRSPILIATDVASRGLGMFSFLIRARRRYSVPRVKRP